MVSSSEAEYVVETVVAEVPTIADLIAGIPAQDWAKVLEAAELGYLQIALDLGYAIDAAQLWAKVLTSILRIETEKKRWAVRRILKLLYREARGGPAWRDRMAAWLRWILGSIMPPISPRLPA